jgi:hypothetical protein
LDLSQSLAGAAQGSGIPTTKGQEFFIRLTKKNKDHNLMLEKILKGEATVDIDPFYNK